MNLERVAKEFSEKAKKMLGDKIVLIILYGSVARGKINPDSDIDIFVVVNENKAKEKLFDLASEYLKKGILLSIIAETPSGLQKLKKSASPFIANVLEEGGVLYGKI